MIIREFRCRDCDTFFESASREPECPNCTKPEPERVFLTPPAIRSPQTSFNDRTVRQLAADYGLSDVSNRHGEPVRQQSTQNQAHFKGPEAVNSIKFHGDARDNFSNVLPVIQNLGGPRNWQRTPDRGSK